LSDIYTVIATGDTAAKKPLSMKDRLELVRVLLAKDSATVTLTNYKNSKGHLVLFEAV
jgi:hypothetical protein